MMLNPVRFFGLEKGNWKKSSVYEDFCAGSGRDTGNQVRKTLLGVSVNWHQRVGGQKGKKEEK